MNIAVVGAGSSGLITLKYLLETYPSSSIVCFEKGRSVRGCWGNQRPDFISTSTKYTTQFSCFRQWELGADPEQSFKEFYRGAEFGDYLEDFAEHFKLKDCIRFGVALQRLEHLDERWHLYLLENGEKKVETFDAVFLCTGLVNQRILLESPRIPVAENPETVRNAKVVVVGGGESAADIANYLAKAEHNNTVFLSLRSGVRVSPRYHPIRGVPSDFLRNRLLLSFDKNVRNWVGEHFVSFRIRFNKLLAKWFPHSQTSAGDTAKGLRRAWDLKLKARAKGKLFNVFHNKSDDFLDAVEDGRLSIIGPPTDETWLEYFDFDQTAKRRIAPDVLVPSTGYRSQLSELSNGTLRLKDFYHGCVHSDLPKLFLIGFARPVIGNIPSISEMQARYAVGVLSGNYCVPSISEKEKTRVWNALREEYPTIDIDNVYPVEQFPYCDVLAKEMDIMPTLSKVGSLTAWIKLMLAPASTTHYLDRYFDREGLERQKVYTPALLVAIMLLVHLLGLPLRYLKKVRQQLRSRK